ncbi:Long-chain-fatty-acid--CoA ligase 4 [Nymphon striatum]|nr:Long-chain-fatty-acid--CoA ligase 4 [Nymphon striatum]
MSKSPLWVVILMNIAKTVIFVFDLITLPIHLIIQKPWRKTRESEKSVMQQVNPSDPYSPYMCTVPYTEEQKEYFRTMPTVTDLFNLSVEKYSDCPCQGARIAYREEEEIQTNGQVFKKLILGDYEWKSFKEVQERVNNFGKGLRLLNVQPQDKVVILADTCPEWLIAALACFQHNVSVVTLYTNLGEEGMIHGILETNVSAVITSQDVLPKLRKVLSRTPNVKNVIFFERIKRFTEDSAYFVENVDYQTFNIVEDSGKRTDKDIIMEKPTGESTAVVMYTSGSTGLPKAVLITHKEIIHTTLSSSVYSIKGKDCYIAYLPLAHILELQAECMVMLKGIRIGYSSPQTLSDVSTRIKKGCKGDISILKPTFMASVPMVLERVHKAINENLARKNAFVKAFIEFCIKYKATYYESGFDTPIINWLICSKLQKVMGGNLRLIASGGAPLSTEVHTFIRACFNVKLIIGYGLTETCSSNTAIREWQRGIGHVGSVLPGSYLKLVDWKEGNYSPKDKPNSRGEVVIGGDSVAKGYFNNDELTKESFLFEDDCRWFKTGDIGEILPNGILKIIDRKKDIVKLQTGEYISLVKSETVLKEMAVVDNICVIANSLHSYVAALIVPNQSVLSGIAEKLGKINGNSNILERNVLCKDKDIIKNILQSISEHCKQSALSKFETPQRIFLCDEPWTPDTGVVTSTFKLKRKAIETKFMNEIKKMY